MNKKEIQSRINNMTDEVFVDGIAWSLVEILAMVREERAFINNAIDVVSNDNYAKRIGTQEAEGLFDVYQAEDEFLEIEQELVSLEEELSASLKEANIDDDLIERIEERKLFYTEEFLNKQCEKINVTNIGLSARKLKSHIALKCNSLNTYNDMVFSCHGLKSIYGKILDNAGYYGRVEEMQEILEERMDAIVHGVQDAKYQEKKDPDDDEPSA